MAGMEVGMGAGRGGRWGMKRGWERGRGERDVEDGMIRR